MMHYIKEKIKGMIRRISKSPSLAPFTIPLKHFLYKWFPSIWLRLKNVVNEQRQSVFENGNDSFDDAFDNSMVIRVHEAMNRH